MAPATPPAVASPDPARAAALGYLYALGAFTIWGLFPLYFKALYPVPAQEVVCHRILWSVPLVAMAVSWAKGWPGLRLALADRRVLLTLFISASLVSINWLGYVYAVETGQVLQASLGYFINPLVNVLLSLVFLGERLRKWQVAAIGLACAGTLVLAVGLGQTPWLALLLAFSFGTYGLLRKQVAIDSLGGLLVETVVLAPLALAYLAWLGAGDEMGFINEGWHTRWLLLAAGVVTSLPLVWFTRAARRITLTALGMVMYLTPTLQFLLAVFLYQEPFTPTHLLAFSLIWAGLALFSLEMWRFSRGQGGG